MKSEKASYKNQDYLTGSKRVHGGSHPEIFEVAKVFDQMSNKTEKAGSKTPQLGERPNELREIIIILYQEVYAESYAAMYKILEKWIMLIIINYLYR